MSLSKFIEYLEETIAGTDEEFQFLAIKRYRAQAILSMLRLAHNNLGVIKAGENEVSNVETYIAIHTLNELNRIASEIVGEDGK